MGLECNRQAVNVHTQRECFVNGYCVLPILVMNDNLVQMYNYKERNIFIYVYIVIVIFILGVKP